MIKITALFLGLEFLAPSIKKFSIIYFKIRNSLIKSSEENPIKLEKILKQRGYN